MKALRLRLRSHQKSQTLKPVPHKSPVVLVLSGIDELCNFFDGLELFVDVDGLKLLSIGFSVMFSALTTAV